MALHEEYDTTPDQLQWLMHLEQERQHLSASVEEALADSSSLSHEQFDEEQSMDTARKKALIPPRLSLQSKMLPAVRSEGVERGLTGSQQAIASSRESSTPTTPQGQNVFKRIAQRLTAVFGGAEPDEEVAAVPEQEKVSLVDRPRIRQTALLPAVPSIAPYAMHEQTAVPKVIDAVPSVRQPVMPMLTADMTDTGQQRLAGKNTKVRLETVPLPIVTNSMQQVDARDVPASYGVLREPLDIVVRSRVQSGGISQSGVSRGAVHSEEVGASLRSQVEKPLRGGVAAGERGSLSGAGVFENGQCECMVKNSSITTTCVVQVMLTANPGPVAVHYVSLQSQVGFTVHLTGPASMKTPFNYIILLCELF